MPRRCTAFGRVMTIDRFAECLAFVLTAEGLWSDNPLDHGGPTMRGITIATYRRWCNDPTITPEQLHNIPDAEVKALYASEFWHPVRGQDLPLGVDLLVMDQAVQSGPRASVLLLQRTLGVAVDGLVGPVTIAAATAAGRPLIHALADAQRAFYRSLPKFPIFGGGWISRTDKREAAGIAAFDAVSIEAAASADRRQAIATALSMFRSHPLNQPEYHAAVAAPATAPELPAASVPIEAVAPLIVEPPMVEISDVVSSGLKGAAAGMALGPIGAGAGAAVGIAVQLVPGLTRWIAGDDGATVSRIVSVVQNATGSSNGAAQAAAVGDPEVAGNLALQLAQIVAEREAAHEAATLETFKAGLGDVMGARQQTLSLAALGNKMAWAAPVVSVVVTVGFFVVFGVLIYAPNQADPGRAAVLNILVGALTSGYLTVLAFWLGSSAESARKTTLLANSVPAHLLPAPAALVPAAAITPSSLK